MTAQYHLTSTQYLLWAFIACVALIWLCLFGSIVFIVARDVRLLRKRRREEFARFSGHAES